MGLIDDFIKGLHFTPRYSPVGTTTPIKDLVEGLSKEVSKIQARSQKMIAIYNLNQEIRELEQQKTAKLADIGRLVYDEYEQQIAANEESLQQMCKETTVLGEDISQLQTKVDNLKAQNNPENPT